MSEHRRSKRFICYAKANIKGSSGVIRNMSDEGFKMISTTTLSVGDGKTASINLVPEPELGIGPINVEGLQKWHCFTGDFCYGFHILKFVDKNSEKNFHELKDVYKKAQQ